VADLLELSSRIIDSGLDFNQSSRRKQELSEAADSIAIVESWSHSISLRTGAGLIVFDAGGPQSGRAVVAALRTWSADPVDTLIYTHGHLDHVGGSAAFVAHVAREHAPSGCSSSTGLASAPRPKPSPPTCAACCPCGVPSRVGT
jgi:glyoxylase-like metal-dependent hydrolase (beta-lactamase superfamily II)